MNWKLISSMSVVFTLLLGFLNQSGSIQTYKTYVQGGEPDRTPKESIAGEAVAAFVPEVKESVSIEELKKQILEEAEKRYDPPIDAKLDSVWKAIPGYNGVEVDIEQTLKLAQQKGNRSPITYIMKETPPAISLQDLGAQPIYKGNPKKPLVALMINVAWGNEFLPSMLNTLKKENVRATFFFDGTWLSKNKETALKIKEMGHELSNHAYSHKNMSQLARGKATEEIVKTEKLLQEIGVKNTLFAPPSGDYDQETVQIAHELGLRTVLWTLDTIDWKHPSPDSLVRKISTKAEAGTLVLMHPTDSSSAALEGMIKGIKQKGLSLGTVSEMLSSSRVPAVESENGF